MDALDSPARADAAGPSPHLLTGRAQRALDAIDAPALDEMRALRDETERFLLRYKFAMDEVTTKLSILREEFAQAREPNPIEHVSSRLKSIDGVVAKVQRKGIEPTFEAIRATVLDIAGVRVTCSFVSDVYRVFELLASQPDIRVRRVRDYVAGPKANGYRSLHAIIEVPVFLSTGAERVAVEVQFRTIAMDFWASLEHKIYYKFDERVPDELLDGLTDAARTAAELDERMERLHHQARGTTPPTRGIRSARPVSV